MTKKKKKIQRKANAEAKKKSEVNSVLDKKSLKKNQQSGGSKGKVSNFFAPRKAEAVAHPEQRELPNPGGQSSSQNAMTVKLAAVPEWIIIKDHVSLEIEKHAYSILDAEVGGMLFGRINADEVTIVGSVPARNASVDQISLTFTHEVWADILAEGNTRFPGSQIVGWYHTHPSFGLFLSEYDSFIQRNFFSSAKQLALVIDPISGHLGWFANGLGDSIETLGIAETKTGPAKPQARESNQLAASRSQNYSLTRVFFAVAGASIVSGLIGAGISNANAPVDLKDEFISVTERLDSLLYGDTAFIYQVQKNDTWDSVRKMFFGPESTLETLERDNPDLVGKELVEGAELVIYAPATLHIHPNYRPPVVQPTPEPTSPTTTPTPEATSTPSGTPGPTIGPPAQTEDPSPSPTN